MDREKKGFPQSSSASSSSSSSSAIHASVEASFQELSLQDCLARLQLLKTVPHKNYFDAFMTKLYQNYAVASVVCSGKMSLEDNKRQMAMHYGASILADVGTALGGPTVTLQRVADDLISHFTGKIRNKRYEQINATAENCVQFIIFAQALVDCLYLCVPNKWNTEWREEETPLECGEREANELLRAIKRGIDGKRNAIVFGESEILIERLRKCLVYLIDRGTLDDSVNSNFSSEETVENIVAPYFEQILLIATAQVLGLAPDHFLKSVQLSETVVQLKEELSQIKEMVIQQRQKASRAEITAFAIPKEMKLDGMVIDGATITASGAKMPAALFQDSKAATNAAIRFTNAPNAPNVTASFFQQGTQEAQNSYIRNLNVEATGFLVSEGRGSQQPESRPNQPAPIIGITSAIPPIDTLPQSSPSHFLGSQFGKSNSHSASALQGGEGSEKAKRKEKKEEEKEAPSSEAKFSPQL